MTRCAEEHFYYHNHTLHVENVCLHTAMQNIETPCYVYSITAMRDQFQLFKNALSCLPRTRIFYALKANSNLSIIKHFSDLGAGMDVVSVGEIERVETATIPTQDIVFSGVGKTTEEIDIALSKEIHCFNIESIEELELINQRAKNLNVKAPIAIRVNPNIEAGGNDKISTGRLTDKFGIDAPTARQLYINNHQYEACIFKGVAMHIGSQITDISLFDRAYRFLAAYAKELAAVEGITLTHIDLGGGLGIAYDQTHIDSVSIQEKKQAVTQLLQDYSDVLKNNFLHFPNEIHFEPGRFLTGNAGLLLTRIIRNKINQEKHFVIVDAAMNDIIRPTLYDAHHSIHPVTASIHSEKHVVDVVGPICETGDFIARSISMPSKEACGDILAIFSAGAYGSVQSSSYNSRPVIAEYAVQNMHFNCIKHAYTVKEQLEKEKQVHFSI